MWHSYTHSATSKKQHRQPSKSTTGDEHQPEITTANNAILILMFRHQTSNISNHQKLYGTINISLRVRNGILVTMFRDPKSSTSNPSQIQGMKNMKLTLHVQNMAELPYLRYSANLRDPCDLCNFLKFGSLSSVKHGQVPLYITNFAAN